MDFKFGTLYEKSSKRGTYHFYLYKIAAYEKEAIREIDVLKG